LFTVAILAQGTTYGCSLALATFIFIAFIYTTYARFVTFIDATYASAERR
jgi:hypothetical protein